MFIAIAIISIVFAFWHYIYEDALLPIIKTTLRYKMFALRDRVRMIKEDHADFDDESFEFLDSAISATIKHAPYFNFWVASALTRKIKNDAKLSEVIQQKIDLISKSNIQEVKDIDEKMTKYYSYMLLAASGGWLLILSPFIVLILFILVCSGLYRACKRKTKQRVKQMSFTPEIQIQRVVIRQEAKNWSSVPERELLEY